MLLDIECSHVQFVDENIEQKFKKSKNVSDLTYLKRINSKFIPKFMIRESKNMVYYPYKDNQLLQNLQIHDEDQLVDLVKQVFLIEHIAQEFQIPFVYDFKSAIYDNNTILCLFTLSDTKLTSDFLIRQLVNHYGSISSTQVSDYLEFVLSRYSPTRVSKFLSHNSTVQSMFEATDDKMIEQIQKDNIYDQLDVEFQEIQAIINQIMQGCVLYTEFDNTHLYDFLELLIK
ncbi:hypothetical protein SS50377_24334 [Spironucleus salmonicida]|uniref:Uncharacterized protein n=1 Tax=Spironucleus salmonicida TaxID=348837 RepID=V6LZ53_9EUKA|nr:hypothetical protein SS50377_24334 [Spironucleus salmonicida]|eukprot:EST46114.1 Hypothetical protein SS50377_14108 [Spironucleus salmonicida]